MNTRRRTGYLLVVIGLLFLLGQFGADLTWTLFVLVPGVVMLGAALTGPRSNAALAVPGSIVTTVGLILFVQSLTDSFETWSYAWGLVLAAVGVGTFLQGAIEERAERQRDGRRLVMLGLTLFAAFGLFFEFLIFDSMLRGWGGWVLPVLLIGGGVWMLRRQGDS